MSVSTLFFGSIGVIAETSDIQRQAYNEAMEEARLPWRWDRETYAALLEMSGGKDRLRLLRDATGADLSDDVIDLIHKRKTSLACARLRHEGVPLRDGVRDLIDLALARGVQIGWVTSTYKENIDAIIDAAREDFSTNLFRVIVTREDLSAGKPDPEAYIRAMREIGARPDQTIAIEDTTLSVLAAKRAKIRTILTPGDLTRGQDRHDADFAFQSLIGDDGRLHGAIRDLFEI
ncbi:MAG: HAD-IA family hydrolase [Pseudomonadota bacterium]